MKMQFIIIPKPWAQHKFSVDIAVQMLIGTSDDSGLRVKCLQYGRSNR
jgi:hypothetical protein